MQNCEGGRADALDNAQDYLSSPSESPAKLVRAQVSLGRQKLSDQVAVRAVQLNALEPRNVGLPSAVDELLDGLDDFGMRHFAGCPEHHTSDKTSDITGPQIYSNGDSWLGMIAFQRLGVIGGQGGRAAREPVFRFVGLLWPSCVTPPEGLGYLQLGRGWRYLRGSRDRCGRFGHCP